MTCPTCFRKVQVAQWYRKLISRGGVVATLILSYLLGFRGIWYLVAVVAGFVPVLIAWAGIVRLILPPRFEPYPPGSQPPTHPEDKK